MIEFNIEIFENINLINDKYIYLDTVNLEQIIKNTDNWKPIHYICIYSTSEIIKYIIDKNVDLEASTLYGFKPFHYICQQSNLDMIKYIFNKGCDITSKTTWGNTAIEMICKNKNITIEMLEYIIDIGCDITSAIDFIGSNKFLTPTIFQYIIDKGQHNIKSLKNNKIIFDICSYSTIEMIQYIFDKGANINSTSNSGMQPIHYICRREDLTVEIFQYIINKGANKEAITDNGWRPINFICQYSSNLDIIKYIINKFCLNYFDVFLNNPKHNLRENKIYLKEYEILIKKHEEELEYLDNKYLTALNKDQSNIANL